MAKVIVLGGGVAGMSAAHELAERGFEVEVYDKHHKYVGGKARSVDVPHSNHLFPDKYLPGEHGFRFFPGFYKHIIDTMTRIPYAGPGPGHGKTVFDNLEAATREEIARYGKSAIVFPVNFPRSLADLKSFLALRHANTGLSDAEKKVFAHKLYQIMTSCYDRRASEYERMNWYDFMEADKYSQTYRNLCVGGLTRTLVAANPKYASVKTDGDIILQILFNVANPGVSTDRVLNGPSNERWLTPWHTYLQTKGVKYFLDVKVTSIDCSNGKITGAHVLFNRQGEPQKVSGDYYILAVPVEKAAILMNDEILEADPTLSGLKVLAPDVAWMNGIQFYLSEKIEMARGHCIYSDAPWALTSISQLDFWQDYDIQNRGHGNVKTILSVDVSNWEEPAGKWELPGQPGVLGGAKGKMAVDCTIQEIKEEVWHQLKQSLNVNGATVLHDDMLLTVYLDHDIHPVKPGSESGSSQPGPLAHNKEGNYEPLLINKANTWAFRPEAYTSIPNFFLAADYVRTFTDLATMEAANEAARRAVNAILDAEDSQEPKCELWNLHEPGILAGLRRRDQRRYDAGLPYEEHIPWWIILIEKILAFFKKLFGK